jgi:VIT1/CCC1 family predicted Fe2+/Mn2+ transporter
MASTVTLEFAGDASKLAKASRQAQESVAGVGTSATDASDDMRQASRGSDQYLDRIGALGAGVEGLSGAFDSDLQVAGRERAMRLARAQADVEQAMIDGRQAAVDLRQAQEDLNQAELDGRQAAIDVEQAEIDARQAKLDAATAQKEYNDAVKEHGKSSDEAKQAAIDLTQAQADLKQANLDSEQAQADARQAQIDSTQATVDATQAVRDGKDAQLNLNDAMAEANPTGLQKWAENLNMITPILSGLIGVVGLVTAAQWAWNAAQLASPTTWIVLAIVALIAVIVLIATKTTWFQDIWKAVWGGIKSAAAAVGSWFRDTLWNKWIRGAWDGIKNKAMDVWNWMKALPGRLKSAFASVAGFLFQPFRSAFNSIASAWNSTVGRLSWTIPGWVPVVGGNSISAPRLPRFHSGGVVPGAPGSEMLAILQAGETVIPASASSSGDAGWVIIRGDAVIDALIQAIASRVGRTGRAAQLGIRIA